MRIAKWANVSGANTCGFPSYLGADNLFYHFYDVKRKIGCANPNDVMQRIINNPTPGKPMPATLDGTPNNAIILGVNNIVTSYLTTDMTTGSPIVVNITGQNSLFPDGYVARYVEDGIAHSKGEGTNWTQAPSITTQLFQDAANELLWGQQMSQFINASKSACGCND